MSSERKTRPGSSTDSSKSREERRTREGSNNKKEILDSEKPEVFHESTMANDLSKKVDQILLKLQKLDNIESRFNDLISTVSSIEETMARLDQDTEALKNKVRQTSKTAQELEESVEFNVEDISDLKKDVKAVSWDVNSLRKNYCTKNITTEERTSSSME